MSPTDVSGLITALRQRNWLALDSGQIALLMGWLGRSEANAELATLERQLGPAGENDDLLGSAFELLDAVLFDGDRLRDQVAGVGPDREEEWQRARFRLLMRIFHPDRHPRHSDWLTSRSQIITHAYAQFKSGLSEFEPFRPEPQVRDGQSLQPAYHGIAPSWRMTDRLRSRLGQDRFLARKLVGILVLLAILPLLSVVLDSEPHSTDFGTQDQVNPPVQQWIGADLLLTLDEWPLASLDPPWLRARQAVVESEALAWSMPEQAPIWLASAKVADRRAGTEKITADQTTAEAARSEVGGQTTEVGGRRSEDRGQTTEERRPRTEGSGQRSDVTRLAGIEPVLEAPAVRAESAPEAVSSLVVIEPPPAQVEQQVIEPDPVDFAEGQLLLGPLHNHQAGELLDLYRCSVEQGDIDGVLQSLGRVPRQEGHQGREWFEQRYTELFSNTVQRALSLHILGVRRKGNGWLVDAAYHLQTYPASDKHLDQEQQLRYSIMPDPFGLKIVEIEERK
jgi:hypothetical protein